MAATLGLFTALLAAVGAVAATGSGHAGAAVFSVLAFAAAVLVGLIAYGLARSVRIDLAEHRLDATLEQAVAATGGSMCGCGHEHDPDEMHITDAEPCAHDGVGEVCGHDCESCLLAALRPAPGAGRAEQPQR